MARYLREVLGPMCGLHVGEEEEESGVGAGAVRLFPRVRAVAAGDVKVCMG